MSSPEDTAQRIRSALEPFVRPREEAAAIRRVLKAHLATSLKSDDDVLDGSSLGLVGLSWDATVLPEARGLHKNYLRALQANLEARRAFDQKVAEAASTAALASSAASAPTHDTPGGPFGARPSSNDPSILQDHLVTVKLGRKQDRLQTVNRYLDALAERPVAVAAGEDYLQPEFIYGDAETVLPSVPKAVVDGLAEDEAERVGAGAATGNADSTEKAAKMTADLENLVAQLEKSVLRSHLRLKEEEKRLAAARATSARREAITRTSRAAKLQALGTARDELIGWIETELGNAGNGEDRGGDNDPDDSTVESSRMLRQSLLNGHGSGDASGLHDSRKKAELGERLAEIQTKYAHYVQAREQLVDTVGSMSSSGPTTQNALFANVPQLGPPHQEKKDTEAGTAANTTASVSGTNTTTAVDKSAALGQLLLIPYLERLLAVAHDQKADISHKAHHNALLSKRLRDTSQLLDHLADESQLLPRYGPQGSRGAGGGAASGGGGGAALLLRKKGVLAPASKDDSGPDGICQRVSAWTLAADSAKIATFESVFEQVEEGQVALEQATQALAEADMLLGRETEEEADGIAEQESAPRPKASDIWAGLDGEVGLLKSDNR
ncbi:hypothetical protein F503_02209 [Ophiostoma piceae UAMH 11346]|uniref:Uncharacterized protein n=1 Tax=Ophiostoma piceae (strain UAMH 11346) TaxID=1262450 RepID=S3CX97_OPHP1|nr:hypothetical protein F503_02209 [Ophiostoma piceae UAMH 11346]